MTQIVPNKFVPVTKMSWGAINLLEGYGNDNPGAKSQGIKQLMAGGGVALIGTKEPDLAKCAKRKDFGQGFYLTTVARIP